jgi:uncharacterized protein
MKGGIPMHPKTFIRQHPLAAFFALAFGIAWAGILLLVAPAGIPGHGPVVEQLLPLVFLAMLAGPSIAGLAATGMVDGTAGLRDLLSCQSRWRVGRRWYATLLITPLALLALGPLGLIWPETIPGIVASSDKATVVIFSIVIGFGAGFFEEIGWTGFAVPRMLERYGTFEAGLVLGVVWGMWHLLAGYWGSAEQWGALYPAQFLLWSIGSFTAFRVLMTWTYSHTRSLLLAQLMHASFTGGQGLLGPAVPATTVGLLWYALFTAVLWMAVAAIVLVAKQETLRVRRQLQVQATPAAP